ncbi:MAG: FG-GAP repeat protein, partial [Planctomycetes bacterium]|nr:FG-GAP repeat protein [Planctomycetota bacterium]
PGRGGFAIQGIAAGDGSGRSVSGAGDVNGDGFPDLLVAAALQEGRYPSFSGAAYVVFGPAEVRPHFRRGAVRGEERPDISDAIRLLGYLFLGAATPACLDAADADDSGSLELTDAVRILGYLFLGGEAPPAPGPLECGPDPTQDDLGCATSTRGC